MNTRNRVQSPEYTLTVSSTAVTVAGQARGVHDDDDAEYGAALYEARSVLELRWRSAPGNFYD